MDVQKDLNALKDDFGDIFFYIQHDLKYKYIIYTPYLNAMLEVMNNLKTSSNKG